MEVSIIVLKKLKDTVERILHVPGNFTGQMLEMAVVLDGNLSKKQAVECMQMLIGTLKRHSEVFRNVRLNMVYWISDEKIETQLSPMAMVQLESYYEAYEQKAEEKTFECLIEYLKKYQARAKLVILVTDGKYIIENAEGLTEKMQPFLEKKMMQVVVKDGGEMELFHNQKHLKS